MTEYMLRYGPVCLVTRDPKALELAKPLDGTEWRRVVWAWLDIPNVTIKPYHWWDINTWISLMAARNVKAEVKL